MADVYELLGRKADARRLRREAKELYERFNESFWWEEEGTYYLGLDGSKRPIRSVASNAGHLLQSGIVPPERAGRVVKRLLADDMWSGWGIRTLSDRHAAYNPFSYHTGTVWPHDNAMIGGGFRRYGFTAEAARVAKGLFDVAERQVAYRLPELFAGLPRREASFPVQYLGANVPQAWAAGSILRLIAVLARDPRDVRPGRLAPLREPGPARLAAGADDPQPARRSRLDRRRRPRRDGRGAVEHEHVRGDPRPRAAARTGLGRAGTRARA